MAAAQLNVVVKWRGTDFSVELDAEATILTLKRKVGELTGVDAKRQKLMGLPAKAAKAADEALKAGQRLMMMGSPDEEHVAAESAAAEAHVLQATVLDDLDDIDPHTLETPVEHNPIYLAKIGNRIKSYKPKMLAGPRGGKKCLVLDVCAALNSRLPRSRAREPVSDLVARAPRPWPRLAARPRSGWVWRVAVCARGQVDYTLFDHRSPAENARQLGRPYLHEFLTLAYERYDIVIWSATSMKWIELKMQVGV
jgi:ubiquitin-like domain-containing CTD phosphatase 1